MDKHYNDDAIKKELDDQNNIYHIISYNVRPAGFSKIVLNAKEPAIAAENVTKLDRIYLLKEYFGLKLGFFSQQRLSMSLSRAEDVASTISYNKRKVLPTHKSLERRC